jgi:RNA polymerase sigma factor (sigma-70 family)
MSSTPLSGSTEELLGLVRSGRDAQRAWSEVDRRYRNTLRALITTRIPPGGARRFDADDVLQSAFLCAWSQLGRFHYVGERSFLAWLRAIAINTLRDRLRTQGAIKRDPARELRGSVGSELASASASTPGPAEQVERSEERMLLVLTLAELPELEQTTVCLHVFEGWSFSEIARQEGCSQHTVSRRYARAVAALCAAREAQAAKPRVAPQLPPQDRPNGAERELGEAAHER